MLNKLTTNYTYFLREREHFDFFKDTILPYLVSTKKNKSLSIWSAGCSSGEEPYTISMFIKDFLGQQASAWDTRILATDISTDVLSIAMKGEYDVKSLRDVPDSWKKRFFRPVRGDADKVVVSDELKKNVIFRTFNLMGPIQFKIPFDVIFCRNVMIYFDEKTKRELVGKIYNALEPGGYLFIGTTETLDRNSSPFQLIRPSIFRK